MLTVSNVFEEFRFAEFLGASGATVDWKIDFRRRLLRISRAIGELERTKKSLCDSDGLVQHIIPHEVKVVADELNFLESASEGQVLDEKCS